MQSRTVQSRILIPSLGVFGILTKCSNTTGPSALLFHVQDFDSGAVILNPEQDHQARRVSVGMIIDMEYSRRGG